MSGHPTLNEAKCVKPGETWKDAALRMSYELEDAKAGIATRNAELVERLYECRRMIGNMCSDGRPPKMSIPARVDVDEDIVICRTISEAIVALGGTVEPPEGRIP